jgi:hypothetical protein
MVDTVEEVATEDTTTTADTTTIENTAAGTVITDTTKSVPEPKPEALDWASIRTKMAGSDEKLLKQLSRYGTLDEAVKAGIEAQKKLAATRSVAKPGPDSTPEELAAYRAANGIPESPDKYEVALPNGIVVGDDDKPFLDAFLNTAHGLNLTPEQVNSLAATQLELKEKEVQARALRDLESKEKAAEELRSPDVWGSEVKLNVNLITGWLDSAPEGVKEQLLGARLADGTPLGNHVPTLKWMASQAREINPMATVVPGSGSNAQQALEGELDNIKKLMADHKSDYWKGPKAAKMQARFRELVEVQQRIANK